MARTSMTRRGTATVVLALVGFSGAAAVSPPVSATVSGPAPAIGAVDQTYTDASGVIHYVFDPASLPGAVPVAQEGDRAASGACRFTGEDVGQAGADGPRITVMRELSFDPATCSRELAVASYTADTVPAGYAAELGCGRLDRHRVGIHGRRRHVTPSGGLHRQAEGQCRGPGAYRRHQHEVGHRLVGRLVRDQLQPRRPLGLVLTVGMAAHQRVVGVRPELLAGVH